MEQEEDKNLEIIEESQAIALEHFQDQYNVLVTAFKFMGKTISEWQEYFNIEIPEDGNLIDYKACMTTAGNHLQEIYNYVNNFSLVTLKMEIDSKALIEAEKFRLGSLEDKKYSVQKIITMANDKYKDYTLQSSFGALYKSFWTRMLEKLKAQIEVLKNLQMSEMARMKDDKFGVTQYTTMD